MKKDLIFKLIVAVLALIIGVGCYFNYKAEANWAGIAGMTFVTSLFTYAFIEAARMVIVETKFNWHYPVAGIGISVLASLLCALL